jgi:hypothetical protein
MEINKREKRPHIWRDVTNNLWVPEIYPSRKGDSIAPPYLEWVVMTIDYHKFLKENGINTTIEELTDDPLHIWSVINYISAYDKEDRPMKLRYYGPEGYWRDEVRRLLKCYEGLYGCVYIDEEDDGEEIVETTPYPYEPIQGMYERLCDKDRIKAKCDEIEGKFVELYPFLTETITKIIENALKDESTDQSTKRKQEDRKSQVFALYDKGLSQQKISEILRMSLRDVNNILKDYQRNK